MKFKLLNNDKQKNYAIILDSGDEVMQCLQAFAKEQNLKASQFEVLNITGDISLYNNEIKIHAHVVLGKQDGTACGGHLLKATTHPTLEIILTESPVYLQRQMDEDAYIPLIKI